MPNFKNTRSRLADTRFICISALFLLAALIISTVISESTERRLNDALMCDLRERLYECSDSLAAYTAAEDNRSRLAAALRFSNASSSLRLDSDTRAALGILSEGLCAATSPESTALNGTLNSIGYADALAESGTPMLAAEQLDSLADTFRLLASRNYDNIAEVGSIAESMLADALPNELFNMVENGSHSVTAENTDAPEAVPESIGMNLNDDSSGIRRNIVDASVSRIARKISLCSAKDSLSLLLGDVSASMPIEEREDYYLVRSGNLRARFLAVDGRLDEYVHIRLGVLGTPLAESELYSRASKLAVDLLRLDPAEPSRVNSCGGFTLYDFNGGVLVFDGTGRLCAAEIR